MKTKQASRRPSEDPVVDEMEVEDSDNLDTDRWCWTGTLMDLCDLSRLSSTVPMGVEDVDSRDGGNPQLCSEYALQVEWYAPDPSTPAPAVPLPPPPGDQGCGPS